MGKGDSLPVEERIDDVWLDATKRLLPPFSRQILHVAERQGTDRVVPVRIRHPQTVQSMPCLFQGEHPVGIVGQLSREYDLEAIRLVWRMGAIPKRSIACDLVDRVPDRGVETERFADAVAKAIRIDPAFRLLDHFVPLARM